MATFVEELKEIYNGFQTRLDNINNDKFKYDLNKLNFCIIDDTIELFRDVCLHLNKLSTDPGEFDEETILENCQVPFNPYLIPSDNPDEKPFPSPGYYEGKITNINISDVVIHYKSFYTDPALNNNSMLTQIGNLFMDLLGKGELHKIVDLFQCKKVKLECKIRDANLENCPLIELILCWKEICRHLLKIRGQYNEDEFEDSEGNFILPGPKCDVPEDKPLRKETDPHYNPTQPEDGIILFEFLCQDFFNGEDGGVPINGQQLQMLVTDHYFEMCDKIAMPVCELFTLIADNVKCMKQRLIPFDFNTILNPENCDDKQYIRIKKLFGTIGEVSQLLKIVCMKIDEILDFYKVVKILPEDITQPFIANYLSTKYNNPIVLSIEPNSQGVGFQATIVVLQPTGPNDDNTSNDECPDDFIMEDKIKNDKTTGLYDELDLCKKELQEYINELNNCRSLARDNFEDKETKTTQILELIQCVLDRYNETSGDADQFVDVTSGKVDPNLLISYKKYLDCLTQYRCEMSQCLQDIKEIINNIEEEHNVFKDVLLNSEYYKCLIATRWLLVEDNKHKKPFIGIIEP
jgi:hypothetical protein